MPEKVETFENGAQVYRITEDEGLVSNIYCERPYCSADSRRFLYARHLERDECEYVLTEFGTWEKEVVGRGEFGVPVSYNADFYYRRKSGANGWEFVRLDLNTGRSETVFTFPAAVTRMGHPSVSHDGRYIAYGVALSFDPQRFGIEVADTATGERRVVHEDCFICNAHAQFHPTDGRTVLVQHNRGCEFTADGTRLKLVGEEGATVFLLDAVNGDVTRLPVGLPHTSPLTGHEAWVGQTDAVIMTVRASDEFGPGGPGNILTVRAGEDFKQLPTGYCMNHIGTTPCGRYYCADGGGGGLIVIGDPRSGETVELCVSRTENRKEFGQQAHTHASLSPDFKWVVFNSDRTGQPETYVASVPDGLLP